MRFWLRQLYFNSCPETEQGREKQEKYGRVDLSFWTVSYFHRKKINLKGFSLWDLGLMRNELFLNFLFLIFLIGLYSWYILLSFIKVFSYQYIMYYEPIPISFIVLISYLFYDPIPVSLTLVFLDNIISSSCHIHMHNFIYLYKI